MVFLKICFSLVSRDIFEIEIDFHLGGRLNRSKSMNRNDLNYKPCGCWCAGQIQMNLAVHVVPDFSREVVVWQLHEAYERSRASICSILLKTHV